VVWLQISWLVVLFGAEISFAEQNVETYEFEPDCLKVSHSFKRLLALRITHLVVKDFCQGQLPKTAEEIAQELEIPIRLVNQILYELTESSVLSEVKVNTRQMVAYHPARDTGFYSLKNVLNLLNDFGIDDIPIAGSPELDKIKDALSSFNKTIQNSSANLALKDL
jgi:membrane protein